MATEQKRYTDPITFQALVMLGASNCYVAISTYKLAGQGDTPEEAAKSAMDVVSNHLYHNFTAHNVPSLPNPDKELKSVDDVVSYFWKDITREMLMKQKIGEGKYGEIIIMPQQQISEAKVSYLTRIVYEQDDTLPRRIMDAYILEITRQPIH